jgi:uncharacterized protein (TIRG00374 family)
MTRRLQLALFAGGVAVFAFLIVHIGPQTLAANARETGWWVVPVVLVFAPAYACYALSWSIIMADEPNRPPFWRAFAITVSGFAMNYVTPVVSMGGEPFRIAAATPWLGRRRATGSVILFTMLHSLGNLLIWLTAVVAGFFVFRDNGGVRIALGLMALLLCALLLLLFAAHQKGFLERILRGMHALPLLNRVATKLEPRRAAIVALDEQITDFYHRSPKRFFAALGVDYLGRCSSMLEFWFILHSLGIAAGYGTAFLVGNFSSLVVNAFFFMPFGVGSKEGGLFFILQLFGLDPHVGVYASIVSRLREISWLAIGFALIWLAGTRGNSGLENVSGSRTDARPPRSPAAGDSASAATGTSRTP